MEPRIPCIILVRKGSKRLPDKWKLPWRGTTLLGHAVNQCWSCEHISRVIVASDSQRILDEAIQADNRTATFLRDTVEDTQTSLEGLRQVQIRVGIEASYVLLAQCTSPFIRPDDLSRLILCADLPCDDIVALGKRGRPSGQGYIIPPFIGEDCKRRYVEQDAHDVDVDTQADYERALSLCQG